MTDKDLEAVDDIFQDSDDESTGINNNTSNKKVDLDDLLASTSAARPATTKAGTLSGLFDDDDDDEDDNNAKKKSASSSKSAFNDLFDSDDDNDGSDHDSPKKRKRLGMKKKRRLEDSDEEDDNDDDDNPSSKKKKKSNEKSSKIKRKEKKLRPSRELKKSSARPSGGDAAEDDGRDAYDSGEEAVRTKEDDAFVSEDSDEDNAALVREYDEDNQLFDDERPLSKYKQNKASKMGNQSSSSSSGGRAGGGSTNNNDPFSLALANLKAKKVEAWSDTEKQAYVDRFNQRMREACKLDDDLLSKGMMMNGPALHKLQMLEQVKHALSMSMLWHTMLERDVLASISYWIRPRPDQSLPALPIRTALYEAILKLPCMPDHLKKPGVIGDNFLVLKPIGQILMELLKHKQETVENKRLLRAIIDKWSREIFSKGTEISAASVGATMYRNDAEVHARLASKYVAAGQARLTSEEEAKYIKDNYQRARAPMILGHMFTVQPEIDKKALLKQQQKKDSSNPDDEAMEVKDRSSGGADGSGGSGVGGEKSGGKGSGEGRAGLLKRMEGGNRGGGDAKRAVSVSVARPTYDFH